LIRFAGLRFDRDQLLPSGYMLIACEARDD
jgi:hypothetical protein